MSIRIYIAKITLLITVLLFLAGFTYAQNTAELPYINSVHRYTVEMSNSGYIPSWELTGAASGNHTLTDGLTYMGEQWVTITQTGTTIYIDIKFVDGLFVDGDNCSLIYTETTQAIDGACIARRELPIVVYENTFYLDVDAILNECNSYSGYVWNNGDGNISLTPRVDTVDFEVTMNKATNFDINTWYFDGTITITGTQNLTAAVFNNTTGSTVTENDAWDITSVVGGGTQSGTFKLTVTTAGSGNSSDIVRFRVLVNGDITSNFDIELELGQGGTATSGAVFTTLTDDNLSGNRTLVKTVLGVPNTSTITVTP